MTKFVQHLLDRRMDPAWRADVRRGDNPTTASYAYPRIARWWQIDAPEWDKTTKLLFAAAVAAHPTILHSPEGRGLGFLARHLQQRRIMASDTLEPRLLSVQNLDLRTAHRIFTQLMHAADDNGIHTNWEDIWRTYRYWDQPDETQRRHTRRRLLDEFFGALP